MLHPEVHISGETRFNQSERSTRHPATPIFVLTNEHITTILRAATRLRLGSRDSPFHSSSFRVLPPNSDGFGASLSLSRQSIANSSPTQTLRDLFGLVISRNSSIPGCRAQSEFIWPLPPPSRKKKEAATGKCSKGKSQESVTLISHSSG